MGHNRGDFRWDAPANRGLIDEHLLWCLDQRERGWVLPGRVPEDNLTIFAATSRAELERALDLDPLVVAGVRRYAVSGCHATEPVPAPEPQRSHWLRS
ncbi:MAG: hypothetical protein WBA97_21905 [Actinophytocola sp.]|uniref:hypothetical protein n=1 Tax=Actinophytocola sp. TaxID=1872138 RepID=UPI003C752C8C